MLASTKISTFPFLGAPQARNDLGLGAQARNDLRARTHRREMTSAHAGATCPRRTQARTGLLSARRREKAKAEMYIDLGAHAGAKRPQRTHCAKYSDLRSRVTPRAPIRARHMRPQAQRQDSRLAGCLAGPARASLAGRALEPARASLAARALEPARASLATRALAPARASLATLRKLPWPRAPR